jgi:adenylate cyclase
MDRIRHFAWLGSVALTALIGTWRPDALSRLDLRVYDVIGESSRAADGDSHVAIVAIDERSLAELGQWPWPRDVIGSLVDRLREGGASAIAFDVLFAERDRLGQATSNGAASTDASLAGALSAATSVASYAFEFDTVSTASPCPLHPITVISRERAGEETGRGLFQATGVICTLGTLTTAAGASGFINAAPDADGLVRRVPLLIRYDARDYPALALAAVRRAGNDGPMVLETRGDGTLTATVGGRPIVLDAESRILISYPSAVRPFPHLRASDVIAGRTPADLVRGRVVFVGSTAVGLRDLVSTPRGPGVPGVEIHAAVAESLLTGRVTGRPVFAGVIELVVAVGACVLVLVVAGRFGMAIGVATSVVTAVALWWAALSLVERGSFLSPLYAYVGIVVALVVQGGAALMRERRRGDREHRRHADAQRLIVQALTSLTETRDENTGRHARRTQEYTRLLANALARRQPYRRTLTPERIALISTLAPLHDIGKVGLSDAVLRKPGALTDTEYAEMRTHPGLGHDSLLKAEALAGVHDDEVLAIAKEIVHTHHERWDGTGYPQGLRGHDIPLSGRLVALVDVYDAMVAERAYRKALPHDHVAEAIVRARGTHFDPDVVDAFVDVQEDFKRVSQLPDVRE